MDKFGWIMVTVGTSFAGLTIGFCDPGEGILPVPEPNPSRLAVAETNAGDASTGLARSAVWHPADYQCASWCSDRDKGYAWAEMRDTLDRERGLDELGENEASRRLLRDSEFDPDSD